MYKPGEFDFASKKASEIFTAFERSNLWPPSTADDGQKMLSFSSSQPYSGGGSTRSIAFSNCQDESQSRNGGNYMCGDNNALFIFEIGDFFLNVFLCFWVEM